MVEAPRTTKHDQVQDNAKLWEETFGIDPERDIEKIRLFLKYITKFGRFCSKWDYETQRKAGYLKYAEEEIEESKWDPADFQLALEEAQKEIPKEFFYELASNYEQARIITDSIVRLDQEKTIGDALDSGKPVLVRGNWRMGKTSMAWSLKTHKFGDASVLEDVTMFSGESLDNFKKALFYEVLRKIKNPEVERDREEERTLIESRQDPFEYLNEYLKSKGESMYVSLDEVIAFADKPEILEYIANIRNYSNIKLNVVLHRYYKYEQRFAEIFKDFETHFIRPLTIEEVRLLVTKPLENTPIRFTDEAIQKIFEITGGRPMEVNNICHYLLNPYGDRYSEDEKELKIIYDGLDIDKIMNKSFWDLKEEPFRVAIGTYKRVYERSMSDEERAIIDRLISEKQVPVEDIDRTKIQPLINTTFIKEVNGYYLINGSLFTRVVEEISKV